MLNIKYLKPKIFIRLMKKIEINYQNWKKIINKFKKKTKIILEPFDIESYNFCKKFKKSVDIKISTSESDNFDLIDDAIKNFNKIFINLSGFDYVDIGKILKKLNKKNFKKKIVLMYGFQSYPSDPKKIRLNLFSNFHKNKFLFGFADHSIFGLSEELIACSFMVIKENCSFFEKHVCLNIKQKPNDYISSLEFKDFNKLISIIKLIETLLLKKSQFIELSKEEKKYADDMHKKAFSNKIIYKNSILSPQDVKFLRASRPGGIKMLDFLITKMKLKKKISKNKFIKKSEIF